MRHARRTLAALAALAALVALLVALVVPAAALAADPVIVTGSVVRDGSPVTGVEVVVVVTGTDVIASTATDELGAFAVEVEAVIGDGLELSATGQTSRSGPDAQGCVHSETPTGEATASIDALPPAPLVVELDTVLTSTVCTATGTPGSKPGVTPPSTDVVEPPSRGAGSGLFVVLGLLALAGAGSLAVARPRR